MFQVGDKIVYPMHGAGVVEAIEEKEILGNTQFYYITTIRNLQVMFPLGSNIGIRPIVDLEVLEHVLEVLNDGETDSNLNPTQRYRMNMNKLRSGDIYEGAQVIRDLIRIGKKRTLGTGDKAMLDNAKNILISELILVKDIPQELAVNIIDQLTQ
ncbi:MAG: CarD family transcriptional regulator [Bacillota bacterium]|nr:CarD family transcriptional regulator [Bacillota bacterium]